MHISLICSCISSSSCFFFSLTALPHIISTNLLELTGVFNPISTKLSVCRSERRHSRDAWIWRCFTIAGSLQWILLPGKNQWNWVCEVELRGCGLNSSLGYQPWCHIVNFHVALKMVKNLPANAGDTGDVGSTPWSGRSPGGGHGNPLQCSCLKNPMDRGAFWATVHGVTKSQTQLKWLSMHAHTSFQL